MGKSTKIQIEQISQEIDLLISQLLTFKTTITKLTKKMEGLPEQANRNGELTDSHKAELLNKRERALQKRIDRLTNPGIKQ
jgi:hypothetical protein